MSGGTEQRPSRLMISNMVLENFKSYAGAQEIGPFHKRFSSIVGPNGSGKSNVIDALLFVFGKRAKQLRLNKVSELIHKSSNFPNLEYARVAVHFQLIYDNEESADDFEVIEGSQFVVTRTAFQNNQSKYTIDGKNTTYAEVGQLLRGHGIDLDNNRFLILQGEVEQIAMMKPKGVTPHEEGLLEYLEDIIGSNKFVEKIEESSKELDSINEQRVEKVNRLKVSEKERDNLSGSKLEAEQYIEKDKDIRRKKNALYQMLGSSAEHKVIDMTEALEKATASATEERAKLAEIESGMKSIKKEYDQINNEYNTVSAEQQRFSLEYDAFERRDVKLQEDMKHNKTIIGKQKTAVAKEQKKEEECLAEAEELAAQIARYRDSVADFQAKKSTEEQELETLTESLQESTRGIRVQLEASQGKLAEAEKAVAVLQSERESISMDSQLHRSRVDEAQKEIKAITEKLEKLIVDKAAAEAELEGCEKDLKSKCTGRVAQLQKVVADCEVRETDLQTRLRTAIGAAEEAKAYMQSGGGNNKAQNALVQNILRAAGKGGALAAAGVRGRLGDLASIDPAYDVAVSTACGVLDYIVVDSAEGGQMCLNYLRENNLGRASFIALSQMEEWTERMNKSSKGSFPLPRLFDLINDVDSDIRPAFYMALRDTLVADNLETAVKVAYVGDRAQFRVVASDGNLIDTSGAMSGGGKDVRSGAMRLTGAAKKSAAVAAAADETGAISAKKVQELEQKVVDLQAELSNCRQTKQAAERDLKECAKLEKDLLRNMEKQRMLIDRIDEQCLSLANKGEELESTTSLSPAETAAIAANDVKLRDIEQEMHKVAPNLSDLQMECASLQRQILNVGGPKVAKMQAKIDSLAGQLDMMTNTLSTKEVEEKACKKQATKAAAARAKAEADLNKAEQKLQALVDEQKSMEADALNVVTAVEDSRARLAALEDVLKERTDAFNGIKESISKIKTMELDLTVEIERLNSELKEAKLEAKKWSEASSVVRAEHISEQKEFNATIQTVVPSIMSGKLNDDSKADITMDSGADSSVELEVLPVYDEAALTTFSAEELKREINLLEAEKNKMKSNINMSALLEYMKKDALYKARLGELEIITAARNTVRQQYEELRRERLTCFMSGFEVITLKLKEMYQMITLGGDAELELLDSMDPFSEGIVFSVRPPKKSWKNISNLSGGEKTLSSLALVFALHHYKPTPLYVMDEIDAALDFKNVSIVANYIKDRTKNAQFVIISLRNNMFELADRLVGIYKTNDTTKSVTINPSKFDDAVAGKKAVSLSTASASVARTAAPLGDATNRATTVGAK